MRMPWWGWIVVGAVLLGAEMAIPTDFYLVFLGLSALVVGLAAAMGLRDPVWLQFALFGAVAVLSLTLFRRRVRDRFLQRDRDARVDDTLVGEVATLTTSLAPGATGRVELRGTVWTARNADDAPLAKGARARVVRVEGLLLHLRREA
jgi:membrane protein implicated in regulation of membrane protease activity